MIRFITEWVRAALVTTAMATAVSTVTSAQPNESSTESAPAADEAATIDTSTTHDEQLTDADVSKPSEPTVKPAIPAAVEVEIQRRFNELQGKLLDDRAAYIDRWLVAVSIVLAFFGIVAVVGGYMGFRRFREIEADAKNSVKIVTESAEAAERHINEIERNRDKSHELLRGLSAETAEDNPEEAKQAIEDVRENPKASLTDKAIAEALSLQEQGEVEKAIKIWQGIADAFEKVDRELAARAHFSVGYLLQGKDPEGSLSAYSRAILLKPDFAEAYTNRGIEQAESGHRGEAIADFDQAISLNADHALPYYNRGIIKRRLGQMDEARQDFEKARDLARAAGDASLVASAEQALRDLDNREGE